MSGPHVDSAKKKQPVQEISRAGPGSQLEPCNWVRMRISHRLSKIPQSPSSCLSFVACIWVHIIKSVNCEQNQVSHEQDGPEAGDQRDVEG